MDLMAAVCPRAPESPSLRSVCAEVPVPRDLPSVPVFFLPGTLTDLAHVQILSVCSYILVFTLVLAHLSLVVALSRLPLLRCPLFIYSPGRQPTVRTRRVFPASGAATCRGIVPFSLVAASSRGAWAVPGVPAGNPLLFPPPRSPLTLGSAGVPFSPPHAPSSLSHSCGSSSSHVSVSLLWGDFGFPLLPLGVAAFFLGMGHSGGG